nr:13616_t:CDS:2 [Entrophospora candida]
MPSSNYVPERTRSRQISSHYTSERSRSRQISINIKEGDKDNLTTEPISLSWKDLSYTITDPKSKKQKCIIRNASGIVNPGEVLAIMGPSGAGKSTFLDLLAGRKNPSLVTGQMYLNGKPGNVKYVSTYVMQDDALMGVLTVRENIQFAADLCFPETFTYEERRTRVQSIIEEFGLERVADSKIGTVFVRGISGGEKRRCAIASQVLTLPRVIFLDEPTTGLDSLAAYNVMNVIVSMAKSYRLTVVLSIHQPSTETYSLFDKLCLLGLGKTLYFGKRDEATTYFEGLGHPCPRFANPADHFLRLVNSDFMKDVTEARHHIKSFSESFKNSPTKTKIDSQITKAIAYGSKEVNTNTDLKKKRYARNYIMQTAILTKRSLKNAVRNILVYWIRVVMYMSLAVLMGSTWWQIGYDQKRIEDRFSVHFFSVAFLVFMSVAGIPGFLEERLVFQRERSNGFYSVGPYIIANTLITMPFIMIITLSFSMIMYPMVGLHSGLDHVVIFLVNLFLVLMVAESMVIFISALIPIFVASLTIVAFANGFFMVVEGYFVRRDAIPKLWKWAHYIDYQKYAFEAIIKNDFLGLTFDCSQANCKCRFGGDVADKNCSFTGKDVLDDYGYTEIEFVKWAIPVLKPNKPPSSGDAYLSLVRNEAKKMPDIIMAKHPIKRVPINNNSNVKMAAWVRTGWANLENDDNDDDDNGQQDNKVNNSLVNKEWEERFLFRFEKLRKDLEEFKMSNDRSGVKKLPKRQDEPGWFKFCYGEQEKTNELEEIKMICSPSLSIIKRLDQATTYSVLSYHIKWLKDDDITVRQSQWMFALLLHLDKLLTAGQISNLRVLCKKCIEIRGNLVVEKNDQKIAMLNIIITIVKRYFGQQDLG